MTTKSFADHLREDRRLVILRILCDLPGYRANSSQLHAALYHLAVASSRDDVHTDLHWLQEQGLLRLHETMPDLQAAELTPRGHDVAKGLAMTPGVSRPGPR
ncbi:ArsR family transcriptional regulator [Stenotrophomonas sp. 364]|uniref:VpaChn25_0724 family phage protein n=1 Tax=Stenotrophomonas sp. 364 TaxID=2691571 RepID=UPI0013199BBD|nr:ArsR family transcriptional regulator [Stenotrophomonas sp. 364]QHB72924.1 ArsR family transcriptional regulator [Stenotrophomonas sp. 364]